MGRWAPLEIIAAARMGDEAATEQLVATVWPGCFRLAASVTGDRALAQDAAQEACVLVYRKIRTLRSIDAFDAWLYRIVMRESARVRRRRESLVEPVEHSAFDDGSRSIDVWRALATLPHEQREVIVLFYFDDLKSEDIAVVLRVPHATVRTRLARARERLRGLLDDYADTQSPSQPETKQHAF